MSLFVCFTLALILSTQTIACDKVNLYKTAINKIQELNLPNSKSIIIVDSKCQKLLLFQKSNLKNIYTISTSKYGIGQIINSKKTPKGLHKVKQKIGTGEPEFTIFKYRQSTKKIWTPKLTALYRKDYIVTRVITLKGIEPGINLGRNKNNIVVDSDIRNIYIHATTLPYKLGKPSSIGCIHMHSKDLLELYNNININSYVFIV